MSKESKIDRKRLKMPDLFSQTGQKLLIELLQKKNFLIGLLVVVAVTASGYYGWGLYNEKQNEKAWKAYYETTKLPAETRWTALTEFQTQYAKQRPAIMARLQLADHYFDTARKSAEKGTVDVKACEQALEWYNKALSSPGIIPLEKQLVQISLGQIFEIQKKYAEAMQTYTTASLIQAEAIGLAYLNLARVYELQNNIKQAEDTYLKIVQDFTNTEFAKVAKNNLRRMKSPLLKKVS